MIYGLLRIVNAGEPFKVLDDVFYNKKISSFDTANCYGRSERIFGEWIQTRGINRNDIHIICKGGHHSYNGNAIINRINLNDIMSDLNESFQRLQITYADTFMFHRDDETVSPEKIIDICDYLISNKLCKKIGVSNWKTSRIEDVNRVSINIKGTSIIEESQIFLNYIKLSHLPYPNIHMITYSDYEWYTKHPEHKIQIYSAACFLSELEKNPIHQNKIFKYLLEYICNITNETKQNILYVLLSKCKGLNVDCIQGSISQAHILSKSKIDDIFSRIQEKMPNLIEVIPCFLAEHPIGFVENTMTSFLMNGFVGPFPLQDIKEEDIDSIVIWLLNKKFNNYPQMINHHEHNNAIKELCLNKTINDVITKYIGYECICYNTEFFLRENNNDFQYTANWHIDPYINLNDMYPHFTLQIGFTDNNDNNSLSAILGSHLIDYQNTYNSIHKKNFFAPLVQVDENKLEPSLVYKLLNKKGYFYLFSNYLIHGKGIILNADKNTDNINNARVSLTMRIISKKAIMNASSAHVSKDIFTLGSLNNNFETFTSTLIWNSLQNNLKTYFGINSLENKTYTWENSSITFLPNFEMNAFGEGDYNFVHNYNIIARFGGRTHNITFNENYTEFTSIREGDSEIVKGILINK